MTSGVYAIVNTASGVTYVGSSINIERRWRGRVGELNRGRSANPRLQTDWSAANGDGFELRILETTESDNESLLTAEDRWINDLRTNRTDLYNLRDASVGRHGFPMERKRWGWAWVAGKRKAHYFRFGPVSLCGQASRFKAGEVENDNHSSPDNCMHCRQIMIEEQRPKRRRRSAQAEGGSSDAE